MQEDPNSEKCHSLTDPPFFDTSTGTPVTLTDDIVVQNVRIGSDIHTNYNTRSRPPRAEQQEFVFDTQTGDHVDTSQIVGENKSSSTYVLQMMRFKDHRVCIFYDSGSNANLIEGALAERLSLKVVDDRPVTIGTAGAGTAWTSYGSYTFGVGPDQEGYYYKLTAQGMCRVTNTFRNYNLSPINDELRSHNPELGRERLPYRIGGLRCSLLIGINSKLMPILLTVLPSGLGVYQTQLKDESGSRIAYGGPHPVFDGVFQRTRGSGSRAMEIFKELVSQYLGSPYVQLSHVDNKLLEETVPGFFVKTSNISPDFSDN